MTTQDDIFEFYSRMARGSSFKETGRFNIAELSSLYPEADVIEMIIAMHGSSAIDWDYGHWIHWRDRLIEVYGVKLIPYLKSRLIEPLHGGGTAYGEGHLSASKMRVQAFCQSTLDKLAGLDKEPDRSLLPVYQVVEKSTGKVLRVFDRRCDAADYWLFGKVPQPDYDANDRWPSYLYKVEEVKRE